MRPSQGFWGTGERGQFFQGNKGLKIRGTGEHRQFWGTGNIKIKILFWGNKGTRPFFRGEQVPLPPGRASLSCSIESIGWLGYHDLPKRTGKDRNGPERTYENTETDFYGYRNGPERTSVGTETDRNRLQLILKRTSMGTRKGRVGYDRNDPNKIMYVWVGRYVFR